MRRSLALSLLLVAAMATNAFAGAEARLAGKIIDAATKKPITNAVINVKSAESSFNFNQDVKASAKDGSYAVFLLDGTRKYLFTFSAPGYAPYAETMKLQLGQPNTKDVALMSGTAAVATGGGAVAKAAADPAVLAFNAAAALANEGKVDEAIAKMEEALTLKPEFPAADEALAKLYLRNKNYEKAIASATKALAADPDQPDMNVVLYESYKATGNAAKAAEFKAKAPANPGSLFNDAAKLINSGKDGEAEPLLKQAIAADPKFGQAYYELGMIYVRSQKNADAKTNLEKYLELEPTGKDAATAKEMLKYVK